MVVKSLEICGRCLYIKQTTIWYRWKKFLYAAFNKNLERLFPGKRETVLTNLDLLKSAGELTQEFPEGKLTLPSLAHRLYNRIYLKYRKNLLGHAPMPDRKKLISFIKNNIVHKINRLNALLGGRLPGKKFFEKVDGGYTLNIYMIEIPGGERMVFVEQIRDELSKEVSKLLGPEGPDRSERNRIERVYVKPVGYEKALDILNNKKLLFITGVQDAGKTAMALHLSIEMERLHGCRVWWIESFHNVPSLRGLNDVVGDVVVFNDAFGKTKMIVESDDSLRHVLNTLLENRNYVILTSRREVFDEFRKTFPSFYDEFLKGREFQLGESSYTNLHLEKILERHIEYFRLQPKLSELDKRKVVESLRLPMQIYIFSKENLKPFLEGQKDLEEAIKESKELRKSAREWYSHLETQELHEFVRTVALFPGMPEGEFKTIYEKITGRKITSHYLRNLRHRTSAYVRETGKVDFIHPDCFEGVWDEILSESGESLKELLPKLLELVEDMSLRLQASYCLKEIGVKEPELVLSQIKHRLRRDDLYIKHMMAYVAGEIGKAIGITEMLETIILDLLVSEKQSDVIEGVYILRKIAKRRRDEVYRFLARVMKERRDVVLKIIGRLAESSAGIRYSIEFLDGMKKLSKDPLVLNAVKRGVEKLKDRERLIAQIPVGKNLVKNGNFKEGLRHWYSTGGESISYTIEEVNGKIYCHGIEKRKDNLGRLYQDITPLLERKKLVPGRKYKLSAFIKTRNVESVETYRPGAVVGVSYVDEEGWTPRIDAFQCEIGFVVGNDEKRDERVFVLGPMPPESTSLWVYFDFNGGDGEAWFSDIVLEEVRE